MSVKELKMAVEEAALMNSSGLEADEIPPALRDKADEYQAIAADEDGQRGERAYHDPTFPKRSCDNPACQKLYTGPAVYCSLACALAEAN